VTATRSVLGLAAASASAPERHFLDLVIDGRPLREIVDHADNMVTGLCKEWVPQEVSRCVDELLGRTAAPGNSAEVLLLICAECGDVECGAVAADVEVDGSAVTWSALRWVPADDDSLVNGVPVRIAFDRTAYEGVLSSATAEVASLPGASPQPAGTAGRRWWRLRR
jgi:hypothetical protein